MDTGTQISLEDFAWLYPVFHLDVSKHSEHLKDSPAEIEIRRTISDPGADYVCSAHATSALFMPLHVLNGKMNPRPEITDKCGWPVRHVDILNSSIKCDKKISHPKMSQSQGGRHKPQRGHQHTGGSIFNAIVPFVRMFCPKLFTSVLLPLALSDASGVIVEYIQNEYTQKAVLGNGVFRNGVSRTRHKHMIVISARAYRNPKK
ncbi:hypothetical protein CHS0354_042802 [Potamilus streckersoni]|uniref:Uncharacterized protein n=1 Tax=Potamilus streckersoni TaxID=2493646 RepID=A0AAE0T4W8_9BIVA|nr:hypothetical protein CHS0354_042802 [Potamilus streckersoni]